MNDELTHYMNACVRLREETAALRAALKDLYAALNQAHKIVTFPSHSKHGPFPPELDLHPAALSDRMRYYLGLIEEVQEISKAALTTAKPLLEEDS